MIVSAPPNAKYNPAATKPSNPPACIWELLRRNPVFRQLIGRIESLVKAQTCAASSEGGNESPPQQRREERLDLNFLTELELPRHNPFAACAVNWSLRPKMMELGLHRPQSKFFTPINGDAWEWIDLVIPKMARNELDEMERLMNDDLLGNVFQGPLASLSGSFNLNTPWPDTPPLFRFHFRWLWAEFDPSLSGINGRPFIPFLYGVQPAQFSGLVKIPCDWEALRKLGESELGGIMDIELATALDEVADLFMHHFVFAVPKAPLTLAERKELVEQFGDRLEELTSEQGLATRTKKVDGLLGSPKEWKNFSWCREFIHYEQESAKPMTPEKFGDHKARIFLDRAKKRQEDGEIKDTTNPTKSIRDGYTAIEKLMFQVYPRFDWPEIMHDQFGLAKAITQSCHKRALEVCQRKLEVGFRSKAE